MGVIAFRKEYKGSLVKKAAVSGRILVDPWQNNPLKSGCG